jgi:hypothetical protein
LITVKTATGRDSGIFKIRSDLPVAHSREINDTLLTGGTEPAPLIRRHLLPIFMTGAGNGKHKLFHMQRFAIGCPFLQIA